MALHFPVAPMKAAMGSLPPEIEDDRWAYEIKWDGYRALAFVDNGTVRLQSSSGRDMTAQYPELASLADGVNGTSAILDGEVVVVGDDGRPSFEALQRHENPVVFQAFDVLQVNGTDAISLPYEQRRALLAQVLDPGPGWAVP
ncbi:MAG: hypothetical protein RJA49_2948, partial [Actinomycetota bacterium]